MSIRHMTNAWTKDISPNKKLILLSLCDNANDEGVCYPSINNITIKTGLSRPTIIKNIKELEKDGELLTHKRARKSGGRYSTLYLVFPSETYEILDEEYKEKFSQSKEALLGSQSKEALPQEGSQSKEALPKPSLTLFNHHLFIKLNTKEKDLYLEYTALRKSMKVKTTLKIHERLLTKYFEFGGDSKIIENAINANWKDFYQPKKQLSDMQRSFKNSENTKKTIDKVFNSQEENIEYTEVEVIAS